MGKLHPAIDELAPPVTNRNLDATVKKHGLMPKLSGDAGEFLNGAGGFSTPTGSVPGAHATTHQNGGSDEINVAGLSGVLADPQTPIAQALLDGTRHNDTVAQAPTRGSLIVANATPKWDELTIGAASTVLTSNGTDAAWTAPGATGGDFLDSLFRVVDNGTPSKKLAIECSGISAATTRTWTPQDSNYIVAGINIAQTFTKPQTFNDGNSVTVIDTDAVEFPFSVSDFGTTIIGVNAPNARVTMVAFELQPLGVGVGSVLEFLTPALTGNRSFSVPDVTAGAVIVGLDPPPVASGSLGKVDLTGQVANITTTALTNTALVGVYDIEVILMCTTAAVGAGTLAVTIGWTDNVGATTSTPITAFSMTATGRTAGRQVLRVASGEITYAVAVTGIYSTAVYAVYVRVLAL